MRRRSGFLLPEMRRRSGFLLPEMRRRSGFLLPGMHRRNGFPLPKRPLPENRRQRRPALVPIARVPIARVAESGEVGRHRRRVGRLVNEA
jgi:hypothetical protein